MKCKAHLRGSIKAGNPTPCRNHAVAGEKVCRVHGAGGGRPIVTGMYSTKIPEEYKKIYETHLANPEIYNLKSEIAKLRTLLTALENKEGDKLFDYGIEHRRYLEMLNNILDKTEKATGKKYIISIENVQTIIQKVVIVINKNVKDAELRNKLSRGLGEILSGGTTTKNTSKEGSRLP